MKQVFLIIIVSILVKANEELDQKIEQITKTDLGKSLMRTIQTKMKANDPIDRIIHVTEQMRDSYESELKKISAYNVKFQEDCKTTLEDFKNELSEIEINLKDHFGKLFEKKPKHQMLTQRLKMKQQNRESLYNDLQRQTQLRETQNQLYEYNVDNLEKAIFAISEVKKLFNKFLSESQHRRKLLGRNPSFLELANQIDLEEGLNGDFADEADEDDDLEDTRIHYLKFAFVEISVSIHKARESLQGISGIEILMEGFEELSKTLHIINTSGSNDIILMVQGEKPDQSIETICSIVIDICTNMMDWIAQLRRWEDKTSDAKISNAKKLLKIIKKQIVETEEEISKLEEEEKNLSNQVEQLEGSQQYSETRKESKVIEQKDKQTACEQQQFDYDQEYNRIILELDTVNQLLELIETKGGQLKKIIAEKLFN